MKKNQSQVCKHKWKHLYFRESIKGIQRWSAMKGKLVCSRCYAIGDVNENL